MVPTLNEQQPTISMNVLMIAPEPFLEPRGTPVSVYRRAVGLTTLGHHVHLLTYPIGEDVNVPGLTIHRIAPLPCVKEVGIGPSWSKAVLDVMLFFRAFTLLSTGDYDIIHSHEEAAYFSGILASVFRKPHLYDMHSSLPKQLSDVYRWSHFPLLGLAQVLESRTIRHCNAIIAVSSRLGQYVRAIREDVDLEVIENLPVAPNMVPRHPRDVHRLRQSLGLDGRLPIVYTGTLEPYQGIDLLLDSASSVGKSCPTAVFIIVGGTPDQVRCLEDEVTKRDLQHLVILVGRVSLWRIGAYLDLAEVLVSPRGPTMPIPSKIYDYLQAGKPIVATAVPPHTQLLTDSTAVLVEPSSKALSEGILELLHAPDLRKRLGENAIEFYKKRCQPDVYLTKLDRVYRRLQA